MSTIAIQCANCGAKYKLPETFTGEKAKCKACGSTMDVKAARSTAASTPAAPAAPAPRPAAKAEARPEPEAKPTPHVRPVASRAERTTDAEAPVERPRRAGREGREEGSVSRGSRGSSRGSHGRGARGGKDAGAKKSNTGLVVGVVGGGVVIIGLVLWLVLGGKGNEPAKTDNASHTPGANEAAKPSDAPKPNEAASTPKEEPKKEEPKKEEPKKSDASQQPAKSDPPKAGDSAKKPAEAEATQDKAKADQQAKDAAAKTAEKSRYGNKDITSKDQVFVPSKQLKPLEYEAGVSEDKQKELAELVETVVTGGGPAAKKAKAKLKEAGHPAMIAIINRLRELDYFTSADTLIAFDLNKLLEDMTNGQNAMLKVPDGEPDLQRADWNGKTVQVWQATMNKYPTAEKFNEWLKNTKAKKESSKTTDEGDGK